MCSRISTLVKSKCPQREDGIMEIFQMRTFGHPRCVYERSRTQKKKVRAFVCELS